MNPSVRKDGSIGALSAFYGRDFQEYEPGKTFAPFYKSEHSDYTCGNPIIIGYCKTGKLAWMEQWIEVCKCEDNGKYGFGMNTASDSCEGHNNLSSNHCFVHLPHPNYGIVYMYDSPEDAIRGAISKMRKILDEIGDEWNKGSRKMIALAESQLLPKEPRYTQLELF